MEFEKLGDRFLSISEKFAKSRRRPLSWISFGKKRIALFARRETRNSGEQTSPATRCIYNAIFLLNGTSSDIAIEALVFPIGGSSAVRAECRPNR